MPSSKGPNTEEFPGSTWELMSRTRFSSVIGPIYTRQSGDTRQYALCADEKHENSLSYVHGGAIMAFGDETLGQAAKSTKPGLSMVTVSFNCSFVDSVRAGEFIIIEPVPIRVTRSMIFIRGDCLVGARTIAMCSAVMKVVPTS